MRFNKISIYGEECKGYRFRNIHQKDTIVELVNRCESMSSIGWEVSHLEGRHKNVPYHFWVSDLALSQSYEKI